jgi:phosphohistidine swiveling domain-containing protein
MLSVKKLYKTDAQFKSNFDRFIRDFGHRGPAEFDIASMNWREDHDLVFKMLVTARADHEYAVDRKRIVNGILHDLKPFERFVFKFFLPRLETFSPMRENGKHVYLKIMARIKDQFRLIEKMLIKMKYLEKSRDIFFLYLEDIENIVAQKYDRQKIHALVSQRKKDWKKYMKSEAPDIIFESGERVMTTSKSSRVILGDGLSTGRIKACARVIKDFRDSKRLRPGEILVTHHTDPGWTPLFTIASGVIIEVGGVICHAAMVARELGVPAVVIRNATSVVKDGSLIILDADEGMVELTG